MEAKFGSGAEFLDQINSWETLIRLHDQEAGIGDEVPDKIKLAVLMKGSPQKLRDHLRVNASVLNTYEAGRAAVMAFVNAGK
eukprot:14139182-Alexandrium_andersonii.AAC.1